MARTDPNHPYGDDWVKIEFAWEMAIPAAEVVTGAKRTIWSYEVVKLKDRRHWALMRQMADRHNAWEVVAYFKTQEKALTFCEHMRQMVRLAQP